MAEQPMLMLHVPWMIHYAGLQGGDAPIGMFGYNVDVGPGPEIFNFAPKRGMLYGYAPVNHQTIDITKLGAARGDDVVDEVLVVWTASCPGVKSRRFVVGWYDGARVFRKGRTRPKSAQERARADLDFNVTAPADRCRLLSRDERTFGFKPMTPGRPGHAPAFFPGRSADPAWLAKIRAFVADPKSQPRGPTGRKGWGGKIDPELRRKIEKAAVDRVTAHYEGLGYDVTSRETEGVGWDLDAVKGDVELCVEVKGVSGQALTCEVTPNEYGVMLDRERQPFYRLCVVTEALAKASKLRIFSFDVRSEKWLSEEGEALDRKELIAARFSLL